MKTIRTIFIIALALCTVAVSAWTVYTGGKAPDSAKITANTPLVQNATSTAEGIEMLGDVFANQIGEDMLTEDDIVLEREKLDQTVNVHIPAYEAKVAARRQTTMQRRRRSQSLVSSRASTASSASSLRRPRVLLPTIRLQPTP